MAELNVSAEYEKRKQRPGGGGELKEEGEKEREKEEEDWEEEKWENEEVEEWE